MSAAWGDAFLVGVDDVRWGAIDKLVVLLVQTLKKVGPWVAQKPCGSEPARDSGVSVNIAVEC